MKSEKDKPPSSLLTRILIITIFSLILAALVNLRLPVQTDQYRVGDIATRTIRSRADYVVPGSGASVKKGEVIVREGQKIGRDDQEKLAALRGLAKGRAPVTRQMLFLFLIFFSFITIVFEFAYRNIKKFRLSEKDFLFSASLTVFTIFLIKISLIVFERFAPIFHRCCSIYSLSSFSA